MRSQPSMYYNFNQFVKCAHKPGTILRSIDQDSYYTTCVLCGLRLDLPKNECIDIFKKIEEIQDIINKMLTPAANKKVRGNK